MLDVVLIFVFALRHPPRKRLLELLGVVAVVRLFNSEFTSSVYFIPLHFYRLAPSFRQTAISSANLSWMEWKFDQNSRFRSYNVSSLFFASALILSACLKRFSVSEVICARESEGAVKVQLRFRKGAVKVP
eukprot:IDg5387t1